MKRILAFVLCPLTLFAMDLEPWFSRAFEIEAEGRWLYQTFNDVDTESGALKYKARDNFAIGRLGVSIYDMFDVQLEVVGAATKAHSFNYDHVALMGRYLIMDDVIGDPVSWTVGVTGIQAIRQAVDDISSFHHGKLEGEIHTAIGKEFTCGSFWTSRYWAVGAIGVADEGSPWVRGNVAADLQLPTRNLILRLFVNSLWGLGNKNLVTLDDFRGYGVIKHRSVDVGARLTYRTLYCGSLSAEYARRVMAKNFPKQVDFFMLSFVYPFGL